MSINVPLTPQLQAFVRAQLAAGHFQSESDVILAALNLLKEQANSGAVSAPPARQDVVPGKDLVGDSQARRSPFGIYSDIRSDLSAEDIAEARREMWAGFAHSEP